MMRMIIIIKLLLLLLFSSSSSSSLSYFGFKQQKIKLNKIKNQNL